MPNYRRNRVPGGTYAFTATLRDRHSDLLVTQIHHLRAAVRAARHRYPFHIDAWVVLPDHMHCLWTLPIDDTDYPTRWKLIKGTFSKTPSPAPNRRPSLNHKGESGLWQRRYWEHTIRDESDYAAHMDYIHFNPVKHGLANHPADWPHSTFARCVARGMYPPDWAGHGSELSNIGERC